jgi:hypothetical protein
MQAPEILNKNMHWKPNFLIFHYIKYLKHKNLNLVNVCRRR